MDLYRIILVDDEEEVRKGIIRKIDWNRLGFEVVGDAENGAEALEKIEQLEPEVVMTDIRMPFMSGIELARVVVEATYKKKKLPEPRYSEGLSPEYWAGWALAEYQWYSGMRFKDIFERVKLSEIIPMYSVYHEMDISKFIETMDERCSTALSECRLKKLRESRGLSQAELAKISGVGLRSIQMYEQRVNDIDKAQAQTIYKLSRVIGCSMEDLLEKPME